MDAAHISVTEAAPDPAPGPDRQRLVNAIDARAQRAEDALGGVLERYLDRSLGVISARARGPKARKGTKWWDETETKRNPGQRGTGAGMTATLPRELKAIDAGYVVPEKLQDELRDEVEPVALRIATDAARGASTNLGGSDDISALDMDDIAAAVEEAVARILGVANRHAREVRAAVLDADGSAADLDEVMNRIEQAHRKGGAWVLMAGKTLANALANDAALRAAIRLGVTHTQWLSKRDERVRHTHVVADGQVRPVGEVFKVGRFLLKHPGDPSQLPESWGEVANCRCGLLFRKPSDAARKINAMAEAARRDAGMPGKTLDVLRAALATTAATRMGETLTPTPDGYGLPPVASLVTLKQPIVAYRTLSGPLAALPGQTIQLPGRPVLGLALPTGTAVVLTVMIPAGVTVAVAGGSVLLAEGTAFEVLGVGASEVRAQVLA